MKTERLSAGTIDIGRRWLARTDPVLRPWIDRVGVVEPRVRRHHFATLCQSIISQQLGAGAAKSIHGRFLDLFAPRRRPSPESLLAATEDRLRACGLSRPKMRYLRALARAFDGPLAGVRFSRLADDEVVERLTGILGVGVWTAEMFLIFGLGRVDVFSPRDLALCAAVRRVEADPDLTPARIETIASRWSPYRSVASLYLWRVAHLPSESD